MFEDFNNRSLQFWRRIHKSTPVYNINKHIYALKDLYSVFCSYFLFHYTTVYSNNMLQSWESSLHRKKCQLILISQFLFLDLVWGQLRAALRIVVAQIYFFSSFIYLHQDWRIHVFHVQLALLYPYCSVLYFYFSHNFAKLSLAVLCCRFFIIYEPFLNHKSSCKSTKLEVVPLLPENLQFLFIRFI